MQLSGESGFVPDSESSGTESMTLIRRIAWGIFIGCTLLLALRASFGGLSPLVVGLSVPVICVCGLVALLTGRMLKPVPAAIILLVTFLFGLTAVSYLVGCLNGPIAVSFPLVPVLGVLLLGSRHTRWVLILTLCAGFLFIGLHAVNHRFPVHVQDTDSVVLMRGAWMCFSIVMTTAIGHFYALKTERLQSELKRQSHEDYLTGLLNRRALDRVLQREVTRARSANRFLGQLVIDIDHFKRYNDDNGHQQGDTCLVAVAHQLQACVNAPAIAMARYGGEEFVAVVPDTTPAELTALAENMRQAVEELQLPYAKDCDAVVTVTIGAAIGQGPALVNSETLFDVADAALYRGKAAGRNCVVSDIVQEPIARAYRRNAANASFAS